MLLVLASITAFFATIISFSFGGTIKVIAVSVICCSLNILFFKVLNLVESRYIAYKFFVFFYVMQPFFFFLLAVLYPESTEHMCRLTSLYEGGAFTLLYSFCLVPVVALGLTIMVLPNRLERGNFNAIEFYRHIGNNRLSYLLFISALINTSIWFEASMPSLIGYGIRVVHATFGLSALLAGYCWGKSRLVRYTWLLSLVLGLFFAVITGSRASAFWPLLFYMIGFLIQFRGWQRIITITIFVALLPTGLFFIGFIQNLRDEIGRNDLSKVNISEVIGYMPTAFKNSFERGDEAQMQLDASTGYTGLQRLVDWTLLFVPNMTPDPIEYRGYGDYMLEVKGLVSIGGANLNNTTGSFYPSLLFARNYGFNVHQTVGEDGRFASHTVPFGVVADSWSRLGLVSSVAQIIAVLLLFIILEGIGKRFLSRHPDIMIMALSVLMKYALQFATVYSLTNTVRRTMVFWGFMIMVCFFLKLIYMRFLSNSFKQDRRLKRSLPIY